MIDLDALEALEKNATPRPWEWKDGAEGSADLSKLVGADNAEILWFGNCEQYYPTEGTEPSSADAELIAAIRNALPELIKLARERDKYLEVIFQMADDGWLMHGVEGMSDVQKAVYEVAKQHPEYKRRAGLPEGR